MLNKLKKWIHKKLDDYDKAIQLIGGAISGK